jgi:hypothetical protein
MEKDVQQRLVDLDMPVVLDVSRLAESIHEQVYPGPSAADDGSESLLADLWDIRLRLAGFTEVCVEQRPWPPGNDVCSSEQESDFLSLSERTAYFSGLAFQTEAVGLPNHNQRCILLRCRA